MKKIMRLIWPKRALGGVIVMVLGVTVTCIATWVTLSYATPPAEVGENYSHAPGYTDLMLLVGFSLLFVGAARVTVGLLRWGWSRVRKYRTSA
jgi:hypothetical protein